VIAVPLESDRIGFQSAGGVMISAAPARWPICAMRKSPAATPAGFVTTTEFSPPFPIALAERNVIAGSIT
jgi:hypothetical protein